MPSKRKKQVSSSEEDSDDGKQQKPTILSSTKMEMDIDSDEIDSDNDAETVDDAGSNAYTKIKYSYEDKLKLIHKIRLYNKHKSLSYKSAVHHLDWSQIQMDGFTTDELKECLNEIIKPVRTTRTLDEMFNEYTSNHKRYDIKMLGKPKRPMNPFFEFVEQNKDKFWNKLKTMNPGQRPTLGQLNAYAKKKYDALSQEEREPYINNYKSKYEDYKIKIDTIMNDNPELQRDVKTKKKKGRPEKEKVKKAPGKKGPDFITPFMLYKESLQKQGIELGHPEMHDNYKNMPDTEKLKYVQELLNLDTNLEKHFSIPEQKLLKHATGLPIRPISAFNRFISDLKNQKGVDKTHLLKEGAERWKSLDSKTLEKYKQAYTKEMEEYKVKLLQWIKTLPANEQAVQMIKHGFSGKRRMTITAEKDAVDVPKTQTLITDYGELNISNSSKKDSNDDKNGESAKQSSSCEEIVASPKKNSKKNKVQPSITSEDEVVPKKKSKIEPSKKEVESEPEQVLKSPEKKKKLISQSVDEISSSQESPKKSKSFRKAMENLGPHPSLTTAHYYMKHHYEGKPKKIAKSYGKLSIVEKKKLFREMQQKKQAYFKKLSEYAIENPKHQEKVKAFINQNRDEQKEEIKWHEPTNTDKEESSSSDSDDSDDSD